MALAHRNLSQGSAPGSTGLSLAKPGSVAVGDLLVAAIAVRGGTGIFIFPPTGWGLIARQDNGTGPALAVYIKYATNAEPATYDFYYTPQADICGSITAYFSGSFGRLVLKAQGSAASTTTHAVPTCTAPHAGLAGGYAIAIIAAGAANTWTDPGAGSGYSEILDLQSSGNGASAVSLAIAHKTASGSGNQTPGSWTSSAAVSSASIALVLYEAGLVQATGFGGNVTFQDDLLSLSGVQLVGYNEAEMALAFPADIIADGANVPGYRFRVSVQNGDGVGTAITTWKASRSKLSWDAGKTYIENTVGRVNRFTEWGLLTTGPDGEPIGYDGVEAYFGATTTCAGKFYGCELRAVNGTSALNIQAVVAGRTVDLVDTDVFTTGSQSYGSNAVAITRVRRLTAAGSGSALNGRITTFNCPDTDVITVAFPNGGNKISTNGSHAIRRLRCIGNSSNGFDLQVTQSAQYLNIEWSEACAKNGGAGFTLEEWASFGVKVSSGSPATPVAGALVELIERPVSQGGLGRTVVSATTDALGRVTFTPAASPRFGNVPFAVPCVLVAGSDVAGTAAMEMGPFTLRVTAAGFDVEEMEFDWDYTLFQTNLKQYNPMSLAVELKPPAAPAPTVAQPYFRDEDLPLLLAGPGSQPITIAGGGASRCYVDVRTREVGRGFAPLLVIERRAYIKTGSLAGLDMGVQVSTGGAQYRAASVQQIGDGAMTSILLAID